MKFDPALENDRHFFSGGGGHTGDCINGVHM